VQGTGYNGKGCFGDVSHAGAALARINHRTYRIPCVKEGDEIFLKTIISRRKATYKYVRVER